MVIKKFEPGSQPNGWYRVADVCKKLQKTRNAIRSAIESGKIDPDNLRLWPRGKQEFILMNDVAVNQLRDNVRIYTRHVEKKNIVEGAYASVSEAKIARETLAIEKEKLELRIAKNEVLKIDTVKDLLETIAIEVRQSLLALIPRTAGRLAATDDTRGCVDILEEEIEGTLKMIADRKGLENI